MVTKPPASRRRIAELAFVLRAILDEVASDGGPKGKAHRAALGIVEGFVLGMPATQEALAEARQAVRKAVERLGVWSPPRYQALSWVPVEALLEMVDRGRDLSSLVLEQAGYALSCLRASGSAERLASLLAEARLLAAAIDDNPLSPREQPQDEAVRVAEATLLARSRAAFSGEALALFDLVRPERDAARTLGRAALAEKLAAADLPASEPLLAFEETFGGLLLPITTSDTWRHEGLHTLVGPAAMLGPHASIPRGGTTAESLRLVPVARGTQEDVYFLDERGAAYYHETIGEPGAVPFGADGVELVTRLLFGALTYAAQTLRGTPVFPTPERVARAAPALGLTRLFADDASEWWCGPAAVLVVLRGQVWGLARTNEAVDALKA